VPARRGILLAEFNKRTALTLILLIVLVSILLRYPLVEHERHSDTFFNRLLADSILEDDYAVWTFHPLSYVGYYPLSYPSGTAFLLAETSEMAGVNLSISIVLLCVFSGVLFALSVFCLSRILLKRIDLCLLAVALSVLAPRFVDTSYWSGSARAPFIALAVLAIFVAFRSGGDGRPAYVVVLGIAAFGCFALHHMALLLIIFPVAFFLSTLMANATRSFTSFGSRKGMRRFRAGLFVAALGITVFLLAVFTLDYYGPSLEDSFASTNLFSSEELPIVTTALNMAASYTHQIGAVLLIAVFGFPFYFTRQEPTTVRFFPVVLIICFVPLLPRAEYITMILTPFVAVLGATFFGQALKKRRWRRQVIALLVIVVCVSFVMPVLSTLRWNDYTPGSGEAVESDMQLFADADYLRLFENDAFAISNNEMLSRRLASVSGVLFLKSGTYSVLSGDATAESVEGNTSSSYRDFPENLYVLFRYDHDYNIHLNLYRFVTKGCQFPASGSDIWQGDAGYYDVHSRLLVVVDNRWPDAYLWNYGVVDAKLPSELRNAQWEYDSTTYPLRSYSIYISERITLYATEVPDGYE
jgi:hypothetical protein